MFGVTEPTNAKRDEMKKLLLLTLLSFNLFGACLEVGATAGQSCSGDSIRIDPISNETFSSITIGTSNQIHYISLYVKSDSTEAVSMTLSNLGKLINGTEDMTTNYYFVAGSTNSGTAVSIADGVAFTLLSENSGSRDGNTIVGYIKLVVPTVGVLQRAGEYTLNANTSVKLTNSNSDTNTLSAKAMVDQVTMVSFNDEVSSLTGGVGFKDSTVDYGNFTLNATNSKTMSVYLKNNLLIGQNQCTMSFAPSPLKHVDFPNNYEIGMTYSYKDLNNVVTAITNTAPFVLKTGKNSGTKVGDMTFTTETLPDTLIAGEYQAVIEVTISVQ
jgi:hypothetical protein